MGHGSMQEGIGDMCESRRQTITSARRQELLKVAVKLAEEIERQSKPHERRLLRAMTENLLDNEY